MSALAYGGYKHGYDYWKQMTPHPETVVRAAPDGGPGSQVVSYPFSLT